MKEKFIEFKSQAIDLPTYVRFSITKGAFEKLSLHPKGVRPMLLSLSSASVLLLSKAKGEDLYEVFTADGSYLCRITKDMSSLLIIGFNKNDLIKQNNAMKNAICFKPSKGVIVQVTLAKPYDYFFDIVNGKQYKKNRYSNRRVKKSLKIIKREIELAKELEEEDLEEEEYKPERRLGNLLRLSEHYSILTSELEEKTANATGKISYFKIEALEYNRLDRVAYRFLVDSLDENIFKIGTRLELEDREGLAHLGEIINIEIGPDHDSIDLLFNKHIDIKDFSSIGWIGLSFSSVNKEVQLAANEKIRNGEAASKYMDKVLGKRTSAGFEKKDLKELREELKKKEYPPNSSQMEAIARGINTKDAFLVMGPPGTGKTTVILEWAKYFVEKENKRVLISSQNNKAVDNVLTRIADEENIDIIRIGSESKLQSEVRPYMFENKIKDLRENIVKSTSGNMEEIQNLMPAWISFSKELEPLIEINSGLDSLREGFQSGVDREILPVYRKLLSYYKSYRQMEESIGSLEEKLKVRIEKIETYERESKGLKKIIFSLPNLFRKALTRRDVKKYDNFKEENRQLVEDYNKLYPDYSLAYEKTLDGDFKSYYYKSIDRDKEAERVKGSMPKEGNKWKLFENIKIDSQGWKSTSFLKDIVGEIKDEKKRGEKIVETVNIWREETESTQNYALNEIILESVDLVGATCIGINSQRRFANLDFDVTIIDEAGQIQIHNALVPMSVSNKLIMLGDHKQIPPTRDEELLDLCQENGVDSELLEMSLFEMVYDEMPEENKIMLDTQYRMPGEIADTISEWFYQDNYLSADFKRDMESKIPKLSKKPFLLIDTSEEKNRHERRIEKAGSDNNLEANIVRDLVSHISLESQINLDEVGVISAYKSQVKLIKSKLKEKFSEEAIKEMVATLDSFQGQERDLIIYSFTKSSKRSGKSKRIGFLNELRRLNVAMTRCKEMLILIGDMDFLSSCEHMEEDDYGDPQYDKSEKEFSDFINKMLKDLEDGRGERISYGEFTNRIRGGTI